MNLKEATSKFDSKIVINMGDVIFQRVKPLLSASKSYTRISSFFSPKMIKALFMDIVECINSDGEIRIVIGVHEADKITPLLDRLDGGDKHHNFKNAVSKIIEGNISECLDLMQDFNGINDVFAALIEQNKIQIKLGAVKNDYIKYVNEGKWPLIHGTFHPKIAMFNDGEFKVCMSGSINETNNGYESNYENATFHYSWEDPNEIKDFQKRIEKIWEGNDPNCETISFNEEIRDIIKSVQQSEKFKKLKLDEVKTFSNIDLQKIINSSPLYFHNSFKNVKLLPHQQAVYKNMLSRWPIKGLIADEVGLGKTIEAGAILTYLLRFCHTKKGAILVPSSLRYQWQRELHELFGLEIFVFESSTNMLIFKNSNGEIQKSIPVNNKHYFENEKQIIFSWHYIKRKSTNEFKIKVDEKLDFIIVDEAHHARKKESVFGDENNTELYTFLEYLCPNIKHKILLSATPLQTSHLDYLGLIQLLVGDFADQYTIERIIKINSDLNLTENEKLDAVNELSKMGLLRIDESNNNLFERVKLYEHQYYLDNHPTTLFTLRNTRDKLKEIGYIFPESSIDSIPIALTDEQKMVFTDLETYINEYLFYPEKFSRDGMNLGFVKCLYNQRIVSSFKATHDSLQSRKLKLENYLQNNFLFGNIINNDSDDYENERVTVFKERIPLDEDLKASIKIELSQLEILLRSINKELVGRTDGNDPKVRKAFEIINEHLDKHDKILIFSRFTSTTNFIVEKLKCLNISFARFQGDKKEIIDSKGNIEDVDKSKLSNRFKNGEFPIIVCSDAASEGLNLQTANVLINIDVPWNPARLLQRFGRIDRFGQKNNSIKFYNLYYEKTIEDRMYSRLHGRNNDFRKLLGNTPPITSEEHIENLHSRDFMEASDNITADEINYKNSLLKNLSEKDNIRIHEIILNVIKRNPQIVIKKNEIIYKNNKFPYSIDFMDDNYLSLNHSILDYFKNNNTDNLSSIVCIKNNQDVPLVYCVLNDTRKLFPLVNVVEILEYFILGNSINNNEKKGYEVTELDQMIFDILSTKEFINHKNQPYDGSVIPIYEGLKISEEICKVNCTN